MFHQFGKIEAKSHSPLIPTQINILILRSPKSTLNTIKNYVAEVVGNIYRIKSLENL